MNKLRIAVIIFAVAIGNIFIPSANAALQSPTFRTIPVKIIADNHFDLFLGDESGISRVFYENTASWGGQIAAAASIDVVPNPGETFLYVMAMGGGGAENWGGYLNNVDFITYPGAQVIRDASPIGLGVKGASYLDIGNYLNSFHDHQNGCTSSPTCNTVEDGGWTTPTLLTDVQSALQGAIWGSAKLYDAGVPSRGSGVCCSAPLSGNGWSFPTKAAIMYRYPLSEAALPLIAGDHQVSISWVAPSAGDTPAGYLVYYKPTGSPDSAYLSYGPVTGGATSATITGLTNDTSYSFKVAAVDANGDAGPSTPVRTAMPFSGMAPPTDITYLNNTSSVSISFTPPNDGKTVLYYNYSTDNGATWKAPASQPSPSSMTISQISSANSSLVAGTTYPLLIRAVGVLGPGLSSATTSLFRRTNVISFPLLPASTLSAGTVTLGVTPGYETATASATSGLPIRYFTTSTVCAVSSTGVVAFLTAGNCIITASQNGDNTFPVASVLTRSLAIRTEVPGIPTINSISTNGSAATGTAGSATIVFTDNVQNGSNITQYRLTATSITESVTSLVAAGAGTNSATLSGLTIGNAYTIEVFAKNAVGFSAAGTYATQVTPAYAPYSVTNMRATQTAFGSLRVNFTPPASLNGGTEASYQYFITPNGSPFSNTPTYSTTPAVGGAIPVDPAYVLTGLNSSISYDIKVVVVTNGNGSPLSASTAQLNQIAVRAPNPPNIRIGQTSPSGGRVLWSSAGDNGSAIVSYTPVVLINGSPTTCTFIFSATNTNSCSLTGIPGGATVSASVSATNSFGLSSDTATAQSLTFVGVVSAPTSLVATPGDGQVNIAFNQVTNGDTLIGYRYSLDGVTFMPATGTSSPLNFSNLINGRSYTIYLQAIGANYGASSNSIALTFTPTATSTSVQTQSVPDPVQQSFVTGVGPEISQPNSALQVILTGTFIEQVVNIDVRGVRLPQGTWLQTPTSISFTINATEVGAYPIALYNGSVPLLTSPSIRVEAKTKDENSTTSATPTKSETSTVTAPQGSGSNGGSESNVTEVVTPPVNKPATKGPLEATLTTKVFFDMGSHQVLGKNLEAVRALAPLIAGLGKTITIRITGYAQPTPGSEATDGALSERRAAQVSKILRSAGVTTRIVYVGAGRAALNIPSSRYVEIVASNS